MKRYIILSMFFALLFSLCGQEEPQQRQQSQKQNQLSSLDAEQNELDAIKYEEPKTMIPAQIFKARRIFIEKLVSHGKKYHRNFNDKKYYDKMLKKISDNGLLLTPPNPADKRTADTFRKEVEKDINKKYPLTAEQYLAKLEKECAEKFEIYKPNTNVTVKYTRGGRTFKVTGKFYRYRYPTVYIGMNKIPFIDLVDSDKAHFDPQFAKTEKEAYLKRKCADYVQRRREAYNSAIQALRDTQREKNAENGYILGNDKWYSPLEYFQYWATM